MKLGRQSLWICIFQVPATVLKDTVVDINCRMYRKINVRTYEMNGVTFKQRLFILEEKLVVLAKQNR